MATPAFGYGNKHATNWILALMQLAFNHGQRVLRASGMSALHLALDAAACLRKPMICSSVNLLFFMSVILRVVDGLHLI